MKLKLSVVIPTYKRTHSLKRLLLLLERQSVANEIEVLVIDQNEEGYLESEIQLSGFSRARQILQKQPNASLARNKGFEHSASELLLFLDDDLMPEEDFCEQGIEFFNSYSFVECFVPFIKNTTGEDEDMQLQGDKRVTKRWDKNLLEITDAMSAALFIKKDAFSKSGGFDVLLFNFAKTAEDQEFFLRLPFKGLRLFYTPSIFIIHDESQAGGCDLRTVDYWITREKCIKSWVFRYRIHRGGDLSLTLADLIGLARSVFINRSILRSGLRKPIRQIGLLSKAMKETKVFLRTHRQLYVNPRQISHL